MKKFCNTDQPDRVCRPQRSVASTTHFGLPNDMMDRAVTRLGWLGLIFAATLNLVHWTRMYTLPELKEAVYFVVFIIVLLIRPTGLFGVVGAEEVGLK